MSGEVVDIDVEEIDVNGTVYLLDPATQNVYSRDGGNDFVGKLFGNEIDFNAVDLEYDAVDSECDEDAEEDASRLPQGNGQSQDARSDEGDGDVTGVEGGGVFFNCEA